MALTLNEYGKDYERFPECRESIFAEANKTVDAELDRTPDSLVNNLISAQADAERKVQEFSQAVWDSNDIGSAEDIMLNNLAIITGNVRQAATKSIGDVLFTAKDGFLATTDMVVESVTGEQFTPTRDQRVDTQHFVDSTIEIAEFYPNTEYALAINDFTFIYLASNEPVEKTILEGLAEQINSHGDSVATVRELGENAPIPRYVLDISMVVRDNPSFMIMVTYLHAVTVTSPILVECTEYGEIPAGTGTVSVISPDTASEYPQLLSVYNEVDLDTGKDIEHDVSFRNRIISSYIRTGRGTFDFLYNALIAVENVESIVILENLTRVFDDVYKIPPNSYQVVAEGGEYRDLAEVIWTNHPAGIQCYSDPNNRRTSIWEPIIDFNGQEHIVQFRIPDKFYTHFVINYVLHDEESFPEDGEAMIAISVTEYINSLHIGNDIIPSRTYGSIFGVVEGVQSVEVWVAATEDFSYNPTWPADYVDITIPVSPVQLPRTRAEWFKYNKS